MRILFLFFLFASCAKSQPPININGSGIKVLINNGGASSINIPASEYFGYQTGDITFTDTHFQNSISGYAGTGYTARSVGGFVEFKTYETAIDVKIGGNYSTATSTIDALSTIDVHVDGVYNQSVTLTADNTTQTYAITLPAGLKIVTLINGYAIDPSGAELLLPQNGVFVQGIVTTGLIRIKIPVIPNEKWLFIGNSITAGHLSSHPPSTSFYSLFREDGRTVQVDAFGARRILTDNSTTADQMAAAVDGQMNATEKNEVFILLGTNNWSGFGGQTKATFKTYYENFLDALHTLRPDVIIYCVSPLIRNNYDDANGQGAFIEDYVDAIEELLVTRTWAKFIYGKNLASLANLPDGLHPNDTGNVEFHDNLLIEYNLLNP